MTNYIPGLVSAIITTHNRKVLLSKAIESVLAQTYTMIECIVVDDASEDGTKDYISKYISVGVIYHHIPGEESRGGNYARNQGLLLAKGEMVAFLDDDDEWFPSKIERQVALISNKRGFVYCGRIFEYNGDRSDLICEDIQSPKYKEGDLSKEVLVHVICVTSTILVMHELLDKVGGFDENLNAWQEYDLEIRLLQITDVGVIRENLTLYRVQTDDNKRNTNNVLKWIESSAMVERKYRNLYLGLCKKDMARHRLYKYIDGYNRSKNSHKLSIMLLYIVKAIIDPYVCLVALEKMIHPERGL